MSIGVKKKMIQFKPAVYARQATLEALKVEELVKKIQNNIDAAAKTGQWGICYIDSNFGTNVWIYLKRCLESQDYIVGEITKEHEFVGLEIKWSLLTRMVKTDA